MLIDWFTVLAQIVNFLILVALLKRFLYGPIISAMDRREKRIAARLREAEERKGQAEEEVEAYRRKNMEMDAKREQLLSEAKDDAESRRKDLIREARQEVAEMKERWRDALLHEREGFLRDLKVRAGAHVYEIARRALTDIASEDLERNMVESFLKRLPSLEREKKRAMTESMRKSGREVLIRSAFEIQRNERQRITKELHEQFGSAAEVRYETCPDLLCGVEMRVDGYVVGWNLDDYLRSLEEEVRGVLEEELLGEGRKG